MLAQPLDPADCVALVASVRWTVEVQTNGCWFLPHKPRPDGYVALALVERYPLAHRVVLVAQLGRDLRPGHEAGHVCHDEAVAAGTCSAGPCGHRRCVNPAHLAEQTRSENMASGDTIIAEQNARALCPEGHPLIEGNLVPSQLRHGGRQCLTCNRDNARARARSRDQLLRDAASALGMGWRDYVRIYGKRRAVAEAILGRQL